MHPFDTIDIAALAFIEECGYVPTLDFLRKNKALGLPTDFLNKDHDLLKLIFYHKEKSLKALKYTITNDLKELFFDHIMHYLDLWQEHKKAYRIILSHSLKSMETLPLIYHHHTKILRYPLEKKPGFPSCKQAIFLHGLLGIFTLTLFTWFEDTTLDQGPTMAKLSELLKKSENIYTFSF